MASDQRNQRQCVAESGGGFHQARYLRVEILKIRCGESRLVEPVGISIIPHADWFICGGRQNANIHFVTIDAYGILFDILRKQGVVGRHQYAKVDAEAIAGGVVRNDVGTECIPREVEVVVLGAVEAPQLVKYEVVVGDKEPNFPAERAGRFQRVPHPERIERVVEGRAVLLVLVVEPAIHEVDTPAKIKTLVGGDHVDVQVFVVPQIKGHTVEFVRVDARGERDHAIGRVYTVECAVPDEAEFCCVKVERTASGQGSERPTRLAVTNVAQKQYGQKDARCSATMDVHLLSRLFVFQRIIIAQPLGSLSFKE